MRLQRNNRKLLRLSGFILILVTLAVFTVPSLIASSRIWQAKKSIDRTNYSDAVELLSDAEFWDSKTGETSFLRARCYRQLGDAEKMNAELQRAAELGVDWKRLHIEQTLYLAQSGALDKVGSRLPELFQNGGDDLPAICEAYAQGFLLNHQLNDAVQILEAWAADFPEDPRPHAGMGLILKENGQFTSAADKLREALKRDPGITKYRLTLAELLLAMHRFDDALQEAAKARQAEPDRADVFALYGEIQRQSGLNDEALRSLRTALNIEPSHFKALLTLGQLHNDSGNYSEAIASLSRCLERQPFNVDVRSAIGTSLRGLGKTEQAAEHFQFCADASKAHSRIRTNIDKLSRNSQLVEERYENGELMMKYGDPAEAAAWLQSVIRLAPNHLSAHRVLAEHYRKTGQPDAATQYENAIKSLARNLKETETRTESVSHPTTKKPVTVPENPVPEN